MQSYTKLQSLKASVVFDSLIATGNYKVCDHEIFTKCQARYGRTNLQKNDLNQPVCDLQTRNCEITDFGNLTSLRKTFAKFCKGSHCDIRKKPKKIHIDVSKIGHFTDSLKYP